jgi:hypothetical protein
MLGPVGKKWRDLLRKERLRHQCPVGTFEKSYRRYLPMADLKDLLIE